MKNLTAIVSTAFAMLLLVSTASAQDVIYKFNKEKIEARVLEIGLDEVKFKLFTDTTGPTVSMDMDDISKISFERGTEWKNTTQAYALTLSDEVRAKKRAFKYNFLSLAFGHIGLGYEQLIKPGTSMAIDIGIIGPSLSSDFRDDNYGGFFIKTGPRFRIGSEYKLRGMKYTHHLAGKYIMPQFCLSTFTRDKVISDSYTGFFGYNYSTQSETVRYSTTSMAINMVYGKQSIVGNGLVIDWNIGMGFGWQTGGPPSYSSAYYNGEPESESYCFSHVYGGSSFPVTFTATLALGFLAK